MKIMFCNYFGGQTGTSSNLAAVTAYLAMCEDETFIIMQEVWNKNYLVNAFLGELKEKSEFDDCGIDSLIRMIKSERITREQMDSCIIELVKRRLYLLPGTLWNHAELHQNMVTPMLKYCINALDQQFSYTFVDVGTLTNESQQQLLQQADIIVLNICQNSMLLKHSIIEENAYKEKMFYLIGNYDPVSKYNLQYIHRTYQIPMERIGVIPYNSMFRDAFSDGTVVKYLYQIEGSTKEEMSYYYLSQLADTSMKLYQFSKKWSEKETQGKMQIRRWK